jgi:hypothetical protein
MLSLGEAFSYLKEHRLRRAIRKLLRAYVYGRERMYLTRIDLVALAKQPLDNVEGLAVRCVRPSKALIASFPHLGPSLIAKWTGPGHFFVLACHQGRPVGYRCMATVPPPSLKPFLRLRAHQLFTIDLFTDPDVRRRGLTRAMKIVSARHAVDNGYRETWAVQRVTNYDTVVASERTGSVRVGTLVRTSLLGRTRFTLIPVTVVSARLVARQLDLLEQLAPGTTRVGILFNPSLTRLSPQTREALSSLAASRRLELLLFEAREEVDQVAALERIFTSMAQAALEGLIVHSDPMLSLHARRITALVNRHRLAAVFDARAFLAAGGRIACGLARPELRDFGAVMAYVDAQQRALAGSEDPPPDFEIVANTRGASPADSSR